MAGRKKSSATAQPRRRGEAVPNPANHAAFVQRLQILIKRAGNIVALAERTHVSDTSIHSWLRGSEPSREKLARLADEMNLSLEWLIGGRGEMSADLIPEGYSVVCRFVNEPTQTTIEGVDYLALKTEWIKSLPGSPSPSHLLLSKMIGDGMSPTIDDGDLVLINGKDRAMRDGIFGIIPEWLIGAARYRVIVRRVMDRGDGTFRLLSDNKSYPTEPSDEHSFRLDARQPSIAIGERDGKELNFGIVGRVIWSGGLI